ncbi:TPA: hypothetical protein ACIECB_001731 [Enterococcus faecium]
MIILATDYIDSLKDEDGNVPALLNCGIKSKNRIILLRISADLAKYLYLSKTAVYYTAATRYQYKGKTISQDYYDRLISPGHAWKIRISDQVIWRNRDICR